jgi:hypothetical protein
MKSIFKIIFFYLIVGHFFFFDFGSLYLQGRSQEKVIAIKRIVQPPRIDGFLDDACWQNIKPVSNFYQYDPNNGKKATEETFVWMAYDSGNIYFAFSMKDSKAEKIWAELTPRNTFENNDSISVILDTYNDGRTSLTFTVNPRGVQKNSVETIWKSNARKNDKGWTAEIAIPFKSLRFSSQDKQIWGINFERYIHRLKETDYWTDVKRDTPLLQQLGTLTGLYGIKPSYNIEFFPYFGYRSSHWDNQKDNKFALGLDFKYGILPNLILDLTASPDFSEVESDPFIFQLSPYEIYLTENRPFFTEGSQYFKSSSTGFRPAQFNLFYSRRIQNPKIAAKVTGKTSGVSFGILGALNKGEQNDDLFSVVRIQKDVFRNSQIGFYYTGLNTQNANNSSFALDYNFNFKDVYYVRGQSGFSNSSTLEKKNNLMHVIQFERDPDAGVKYQLYYMRVEKNVDVQTGYISRTNTQFVDMDLGYAWRFNKGFVKHLFVNFSPNLEYDCKGANMLTSFSFMNHIEFLPKLELRWWYEKGKSKYQIYDESEELIWSIDFIDMEILNVNVGWEQGGFFKRVNLEARWEHRGIYNSDFTAVEPGSQLGLEFFLSFRPWANFEFSLGGEYAHQVLDSTGERVFEGLTYQASLHYQITRKLFITSLWSGESRDEQYNFDLLAGYYFGAGNIIQLSFKKSARIEGAERKDGYSLTLKVSYLLRI